MRAAGASGSSATGFTRKSPIPAGISTDYSRDRLCGAGRRDQLQLPARSFASVGDMIGRALELGMTGIGIADRNSVAGVVRAWMRSARCLRAGRGWRRRKSISG